MTLRFYKTPRLLKKMFPEFTWEMPSTDKKIYLTFDDGPIPEITEFVLDILAQFGAKASFFCVGDNIRKHPQIFAKVVEAGHSIGNHTFNHLKGWNTTTPKYVENIELCQQIIVENLIELPKKLLFRPPYGRIKTAQFRQIKNEYTTIMWDVLTNDYDRSLDKRICLQKAIQHSVAGSIVVFHDSIKAEANLRYVLPRYLAYFQEEGYTFEAL